MPPKNARKLSDGFASQGPAANPSADADGSTAPASQTQQQPDSETQDEEATHDELTQKAMQTPRATRSKKAPLIPHTVLDDVMKTTRKPNDLRGTSVASSVHGRAPSVGNNIAADSSNQMGAGARAGSFMADDSNAMAGASTTKATGFGSNLGAITEMNTPIRSIERQNTQDVCAVGNDRINSQHGSVARRSPVDSLGARQVSPNVPLANGSRQGSRHSRQSLTPHAPVGAPPRASPAPPIPPPATGAAADHINGRPSLSPNHGTPVPANPAPNPNPNPDTGAENQVADPNPSRSDFWAILQEQVMQGMSYITRRRNWWVATLAFFLLCIQICSLGNICVQNRFWTVFFTFVGRHPWEYICLFIANALMIAGVMDMSEGIVSVVNGIGIRAARKEFQAASPEWREASWVRLLEDIHDKVLEPFLVLIMTSALRFLVNLGDISSASQLVTVSLILHLTKWVFEAIAIYRAYDDWLFQGRKRLFMDLLLLLVPVVTTVHWSSMPKPMDGFDAAMWFNNARTSEKKPMGRVRIQHLRSDIPQRAGAVHEVTNVVVTKWVEPTRRT